uniref:GntR family transcriptional regulator n=1 Tax=Schlesneria paludicola TaxID=360056 RepID=A0A7C4QRP4_9PLAN
MPAATNGRVDTPLHGLRRESIVASVLGDILHGRIKGGQRLVTQGLAERFGVSHTPIREALSVLSGMGVITLEPNRGAVVRRVTAREVREVCQVRRVLECEAVRLACGRIDRAALKALTEDLQRFARSGPPLRTRSILKAQELDSRLHDLIAASTGNAFLAHELNRLKLLFRAFRDAAWEHDHAQRNYERLPEEVREHLEIVDNLRSGRRREAVLAMSRHIRSGMLYWTRALPVPARSSSPSPPASVEGTPPAAGSPPA